MLTNNIVKNITCCKTMWYKFFIYWPFRTIGYKFSALWDNSRYLLIYLFLFLYTALYGVLFENDEEAAFSNYRLWESMGFIFAFILQNLVCINVKLWIVLVVVGCGMIGYLIIEANEWAKKKRRQLRENGGDDTENGILHTITSMLSCINTETRV